MAGLSRRDRPSPYSRQEEYDRQRPNSPYGSSPLSHRIWVRGVPPDTTIPERADRQHHPAASKLGATPKPSGARRQDEPTSPTMTALHVGGAGRTSCPLREGTGAPPRNKEPGTACHRGLRGSTSRFSPAVSHKQATFSRSEHTACLPFSLSSPLPSSLPSNSGMSHVSALNTNWYQEVFSVSS